MGYLERQAMTVCCTLSNVKDMGLKFIVSVMQAQLIECR